MKKLFGTDGIRGVANDELTAELAFKVGRASAYKLKDSGKKSIVIGRDTRYSGPMLQAAISSGIMSTGMNVIDVGIIPTPAIAYLTRKYGAAAGIVISASHNPYEFNGIKYFSDKGFKLPDQMEIEMEELIENIESIDLRPIGKDLGNLRIEENSHRDYIDYLKSRVDLDLRAYKIALDTGHGATATIARTLFEELGAEVHIINEDFDGTDINKNCGSTNPKLIQELVLEEKCQLGLSFDGDGDRLIAVDENGNIMDGDHFLAACGTSLMNRGKLPNNTVVGTVMANIGLMEYAEKVGMNILMTSVGDRYVLEKMIEGGYTLGGEQSGHFIFLEDNTTGDGLMSALKLIETMKYEEKTLSQLNALVNTYPQVLKNAKVSNKVKYKYMEDEEIAKAIETFEKEFNKEGRVLIRPSGTEPLVRVMVEGKDQKVIEEKAQELADLIERRLK